MASFPNCNTSSPNCRKSQFTFKQLKQLAEYSVTTPLRCIAHVDLDAFYAQCELVRLGLPEDTPLAVQQWQGLIAINYPARKFGLGRHITCTEAKKLCPHLVMQHVATWKEGDERWAYHLDAFANMATHKVSLDPYRMQSRKILALIKEFLPSANLQRVEKAGVDEVFLDLSSQVHSLLLERYPELSNPPPYDDLTENLPWPSISAIDWNADALAQLDTDHNEDEDPDWDDVGLSIASEIVRNLRAAIYTHLKYTCSGGIARNKMLAKLGSAHNKPNAQTVIRNRAVQQFLNGKKFTKIRNLGGKLGDEAVAMFDTDEVKGLINIPLEQLQKLGTETGSWLYMTIRGQDTSEVNPRTQIKSMLSAKSFRPTINSFEQGTRWMRIFAADIFSRCVEEGVLENKRRPKTLNLHHRSGNGITRSKQLPIPLGMVITEDVIFTLAKTLLAQIVVDGRAWPCANLSLSAAGFENSISGNMGIKGFLLEGEEARALLRRAESWDQSNNDSDEDERPEKRRKVNEAKFEGIQRFFLINDDKSEDSGRSLVKLRDDQVVCDKCDKVFTVLEKVEHDDWHFAKELETEMRRETNPTKITVQVKAPIKSNASTGGKNQTKLKFGNG